MPTVLDERRITMRDGTRLAQNVWTPPAPRGTVVIVHGLGEHMGRYTQLAADLAAEGWAVRVADQRGHGRSDGARGAVPSQEAIRDDVLDTLQLTRLDATGPVILLGHSMGGSFAAWAIAHAPDAADGLILSSPALRADLSAIQRLLMRTMIRIAPDVAISNGLKVDFISHDRAVVDAYRSDPLVHDRVSSRLAQAILTAATSALAAAPHWRVPTLLLYAGDDRLVNPRGSQDFASAAPASVVTARRFDSLYHELFNELERAGPVRAVIDWLRTWPAR